MQLALDRTQSNVTNLGVIGIKVMRGLKTGIKVKCVNKGAKCLSNVVQKVLKGDLLTIASELGQYWFR